MAFWKGAAESFLKTYVNHSPANKDELIAANTLRLLDFFPSLVALRHQHSVLAHIHLHPQSPGLIKLPDLFPQGKWNIPQDSKCIHTHLVGR